MEKKAIKLKIPPKDGNERTGKNRNEDTPLILLLGKEKKGIRLGITHIFNKKLNNLLFSMIIFS